MKSPADKIKETSGRPLKRDFRCQSVPICVKNRIETIVFSGCLKAVLIDKKGETLMESIVSTALLSIFLVGITTMIITSLRIVNISGESAYNSQNNANRAVFEEYPTELPADMNLTLTDLATAAPTIQPVDIPVKMLKEEFTAFKPGV